ncbi:MAG: hypothetical protein Q7K65_03220 [Candidatus Buchananbacteria bacterium]|nr:hypothetical protein [Candidatus Buchananbacteria bacterium]
MHLPVMDQSYRDVAHLNQTLMEVMFWPFGLKRFLFLVFMAMFLGGLLADGSVYVSLYQAIIGSMCFTTFVFLFIMFFRCGDYRVLVGEIKGHYRIKLNSYFKIIDDGVKNLTVALAYGFKDDFNPTQPVLAEYFIKSGYDDYSTPDTSRIFKGKDMVCLYYSSDPDTVFITKYGLKIKIIGRTSDGYLEFEIMGLKRFGFLFS